MTDSFDSRLHSEMRRRRAARSLKTLKVNNFRKYYKADEEAFRKLISELERHLRLAHKYNQSNYAQFAALWSSVEGFS